MKKQFLNPPTSPTPMSYHHTVAVEGGRTIYLAGQVAFDAERNIVGLGDLGAQIRHALKNLTTAVEAGGGDISDMVQITTHVVDYDPAQLDSISAAIAEFFPPERLPANTLVGVSSLSTEGLLVEIGGIAVTAAPLP